MERARVNWLLTTTNAASQPAGGQCRTGDNNGAQTELIFQPRYSITESIGDRTTTTIALVVSVARTDVRVPLRPTLSPTDQATKPVSHYRIALEKKSRPGRQFTGKNPPRPAEARIFTGKLSAGGDFWRGSDPIMVRLFNGACERYFNKWRPIKFVIISPRADFS